MLVPFKVLKAFTANGKVLQTGDVVELEPSRRTQSLVEYRYMVQCGVEPPKTRKQKLKEEQDGAN